MWRITKKAVVFVVLVEAIVLSFAGTARAQAGVAIHSGTLKDGASYLIEVPASWNGTLFQCSHCYVVLVSPNPAQDFGDPFTRMP
jgi:hypothetical protein